jgi:hypothetical protein
MQFVYHSLVLVMLTTLSNLKLGDPDLHFDLAILKAHDGGSAVHTC